MTILFSLLGFYYRAHSLLQINRHGNILVSLAHRLYLNKPAK